MKTLFNVIAARYVQFQSLATDSVARLINRLINHILMVCAKTQTMSGIVLYLFQGELNEKSQLLMTKNMNVMVRKVITIILLYVEIIKTEKSNLISRMPL